MSTIDELVSQIPIGPCEQARVEPRAGLGGGGLADVRGGLLRGDKR